MHRSIEVFNLSAAAALRSLRVRQYLKPYEIQEEGGSRDYSCPRINVASAQPVSGQRFARAPQLHEFKRKTGTSSVSLPIHVALELRE